MIIIELIIIHWFKWSHLILDLAFMKMTPIIATHLTRIGLLRLSPSIDFRVQILWLCTLHQASKKSTWFSSRL